MFVVAVKHIKTGRTADIRTVAQDRIQESVCYFEHLYHGKFDRYKITVRKER